MSSDLRGLCVAITASRRANEQASLIRSHGGTALLAPTIGIVSNPEIASEAKRFLEALRSRTVDYVVFMTGPGVFSIMEELRAEGMERAVVEALKNTKVVARSGKPKAALTQYGIPVDLVPQDATSAGLIQLLGEDSLSSKTIFVVAHGSEPSELSGGLRSMGAEVEEFSSYSYSLETDSSGAEILGSMRFNPVLAHEGRVLELLDAIASGKVDAITFTSPPSARNLFAVASKAGRLDELVRALRGVVVVAIGIPTRSAIEASGVVVDVVPSVYKMGPMIKGLCDYVRANGPTRSPEGDG